MKINEQLFRATVLAAWLIVCCMAAQGAAAGGQPESAVHDLACVTSKTVLLKDIATITARYGIADGIANIVVGSAPLPGKDRIFKRAHIITRLKQHKIDLKKTSLSCPEQIRVTTLYKEFGQREIEEIITKHIYEQMPWDRREVTVSDVAVKPFRIADGHVTYNIEVGKNEGYLGRFSARVLFFVNGQFAKHVDVGALIRVITPVVVSARHIDRKQVITEEDIAAEEKDITHLGKDYVISTHDVVGMRATCDIGPDRIIKPAMFEKTPLIHKGDQVTVFVETDSFRISTAGEALQDGHAGDRIEIANTSSNQKLYGYVKSGKEVEVRF